MGLMGEDSSERWKLGVLRTVRRIGAAAVGKFEKN